MADPTIQTFCCLANNRTRLGLDGLLHYHYESYNAISIFSSLLGITGAIYQILPRYNEGHGRMLNSYIRGRRIIVWLATADLLASLAVLIRSSSWLISQAFATNTTYYVGSLFCAISSGWIEYFYSATCLWTLIYAIDVLRVMEGGKGSNALYHLLVWGIPFVLTVLGLTILYYPDINCHAMESNPYLRILPNFIFMYTPIVLVMTVNPILYFKASNMAEKVVISSGKYTTNERNQLRTLRYKFLAINFVFILCWTPNLINAVAVWTMWKNLPETAIYATAYFMAFLNPLQALLNAIVYRKWNESPSQIRFPWSKKRTLEEDFGLLESDNSPELEDDEDELNSFQKSGEMEKKGSESSINGYGSIK